MKIKWFKIITVLVIFVITATPLPAFIEGSPHDLSVVGGRQLCDFCHTPHGAMSSFPLWSHELSAAVYTIYQSSSLDAQVGQPTGSSKLCLSCHDGTVALGHSIKGIGSDTAHIGSGSAELGTDLADDHPISFVYSDSLSTEDIQIKPPSALPAQLKLDRSDELQCTTCHDSHDNQFGRFLVMSNIRSAMCTSCHDLKDWTTSGHANSTSLVSGSSDQFLQQSQYDTVASNACLSCHRPHSAGGAERLLHFAKSEDNCMNCHDGSVAATDLTSELSKQSRHGVLNYNNIHDLKEDILTAPEHVECVDCHNPHSTRQGNANAPLVPGAMKNVSGITASGSVVQNAQFEYEVCFKCHGDNPNRIGSSITRDITQTNTRLEFNPSNPSYHPVEAAGVNQDVPSLKLPYDVSSMIYCTDCHNTDGSSGLKGPHGSVYPYLLAYNYETADFTQESSFAYELCYNCHSRNNILNDESFSKHKKHIQDADIPCSACHDPHGISSSQGSGTTNSHLMNFDRNIVFPSSTGRLEFEDRGVFRGRCYLNCHDKDHRPKSY